MDGFRVRALWHRRSACTLTATVDVHRLRVGAIQKRLCCMTGGGYSAYTQPALTAASALQVDRVVSRGNRNALTGQEIPAAEPGTEAKYLYYDTCVERCAVLCCA